jgi:2-iminobutanoate/2-iminopropanoate deaminase
MERKQYNIMTSDNTVKPVETHGAPKPGGHYSQGCANNNLLFVSGQLPVALDGTPRPDLDFKRQAEMALANLLAIVEAGGSAKDLILKVTAYIAGVEHWPAFNAVYAEILGDCRPARSVVPVPALHYGCLIELEAFAALR